VTVKEFLERVQGYCNAQYTDVQLREVFAWAKSKTGEKLDCAYRCCVEFEDIQYKSLPGISKLNGYLRDYYSEEYKALPEPEVSEEEYQEVLEHFAEIKRRLKAESA
jgi:hypothetical protein